MPHSLLVAAHADPVGHISFDAAQDRYTFDYTQEWARRKDAFLLSPHIPLVGDAPRAGVVHRFQFVQVGRREVDDVGGEDFERRTG